MIATKHAVPPFPPQQQANVPGLTAPMNPQPDDGEESYVGHGQLAGNAAIITGGDSGIGSAVAIAFAREGADMLVSYLNEHDDAQETQRWAEKAGRRAVLMPGDIRTTAHCNGIVEHAI
ncbi:hypothetical protein PBP221_84190 (plasmid) [Paraburkholderia sp. 22B1P]|nr:hypothetical protein PBP221_84190 [Paraburkholderia sp. 22B1P]